MLLNHVDHHFPDNYGNTGNFIFPITHEDALTWLKAFIKDKLENFGPYQDFILNKEPYLFHFVYPVLLILVFLIQVKL